jgi:hypothetical protein
MECALKVHLSDYLVLFFASGNLYRERKVTFKI